MSGPPFDWETDDPHPWLWDGDFDSAWDWPVSVYEPCPLGCHLGSAEFGPGFWFECPGCGGTGLGKEHRC